MDLEIVVRDEMTTILLVGKFGDLTMANRILSEKEY